jgi:hypothetical protein
VTFAEAGEHKIRIRVKHAVEKKVSKQTIRVDSALFFFLDPIIPNIGCPFFFIS